MDTVFIKNEDVVFRKIESEYLLIPVVRSAADIESVFNLNETGSAIWEKIDGARSMRNIVEEMETEYENKERQIENDILSFISEMLEANLVVAKRRSSLMQISAIRSMPAGVFFWTLGLI